MLVTSKHFLKIINLKNVLTFIKIIFCYLKVKNVQQKNSLTATANSSEHTDTFPTWCTSQFQDRPSPPPSPGNPRAFDPR